MSRMEALPDEILQCILFYLPAQSTVALQATTSRFHDVTNEPLLWRQYCITDFRYWSERHRIKSKLNDHHFLDWKKLYTTRQQVNRTTTQAIEEIIASPVGQLDRIQKIVGLGYDAKDMLLRLFRAAESTPDVLAQRYWTHTTLGCLHRALALDEWTALKFRDVGDDTYERAVGAFDLFVLDEREEGDINDIFDRLDYYVARVRQSRPEIDAMSPRETASYVAGYLLGEGWTGIRSEPAVSYYAIDHMFLGVALFSERRNSIPLITVLIYCYVLRKLGLRAAPCSFPWHVHAVVRPPLGYDLDGEPLPPDSSTAKSPDHVLYMDPFYSPDPVPQSTLDEQLNFIAHRFDVSQRAAFLAEADARGITIRNARNILNSPTQNPDPPYEPIDSNSAAYAAKWASVLLPSSVAQLRQCLTMLMDDFIAHFQCDVPLLEKYVLPLTANLPGYQQCQEVCREARRMDVTPPVPKHRTQENRAVSYQVGQVFRHRRQGYIAAITGWDASCQMDEQWIQLNSVDRLPAGRTQPFYHVFVQDRSVRYVAQENINLIQMGKEGVAGFSIEIGKYFRRWDNERKVFVSNLEEEYPDH